MRVIILGGGWTGVTYALELKLRFGNIDVLVLDRGPLGGLLRSTEIRGHTFDIGGSHVIFSSDNTVLDKILSFIKYYITHKRMAFVQFNDQNLVPYPLENGIYVLPPQDRVEAVTSFLEAYMALDPKWRPKNLYEWIKGFFGRWFAEKYLIPYNLKIWKRPLDQIDVDWIYVPGRLPIPDWREVVKAAVGIPTEGYKEQSTFYYPMNGGIETQYRSALNEALKLGVKVVEGVEVREIKRINDEWVINGQYRGKRLVNTVPLPELVEAMDAPEDIRKSAQKLDYNQVAVVGIAVKGRAPMQHWIYVPDRDIIFHRYAWSSNYSPNNAPPGEANLIAEITIPKEQQVSPEYIKSTTLKGLEKLNIVENILFTEIWIHKYGYPVHTIESNKHRAIVLQWLKDQNVVTTGRWGAWAYWNTDRIYKTVLESLNQWTEKSI